MKPANAARKADYRVRRIEHAAAAALIEREHYARGASNTSVYAFGLIRGLAIVGASIWLPPTKNCARSVAGDDWRNVLSLSRLAVVPGEPTNAASILVGGSIREIRRERLWSWLVTFADESQGHTGTIYRATNWRYVGKTKPEPRWVDATGKQVSRLATKSRTAEQMRALGHTLQGCFAKHKFVMFLGPSRPRGDTGQLGFAELATDRSAAE